MLLKIPTCSNRVFGHHTRTKKILISLLFSFFFLFVVLWGMEEGMKIKVDEIKATVYTKNNLKEHCPRSHLTARLLQWMLNAAT